MCDEQRGDNVHMALYTIMEHWHWPLEEMLSCFQTYRIFWQDGSGVVVCGVIGRQWQWCVVGCGVGRSAVAVVWWGGV